MKVLTVSILLIFSLQMVGQTKYTCIKKDSITINKSANYIGRDNLFNHYYLINNELFKDNKDKTFNYKNFGLGEITDIAIENPLQIVLLYKNFNTVVLLDNQLNEVQKIDFNTINPNLIISSIGFGGQNKLWIYDSNSQKVGVYDLITSTIKFISTSLNGAISKITSTYNLFYFTNENNEFQSISIYGKIENLGHLPLNDNFCFLNENKIIYTTNNLFYVYDFNLKTISELNINEKSFQNFFFKDGILSIFTQNKIINYQINF